MEKMKDWIGKSGTGEDAQEGALIDNLTKIGKDLDFAVSSYQTSLVNSKEPIKGVLDAAKKLIEEINKISEKK